MQGRPAISYKPMSAREIQSLRRQRDLLVEFEHLGSLTPSMVEHGNRHAESDQNTDEHDESCQAFQSESLDSREGKADAEHGCDVREPSRLEIRNRHVAADERQPSISKKQELRHEHRPRRAHDEMKDGDSNAEHGRMPGKKDRQYRQCDGDPASTLDPRYVRRELSAPCEAES